MELAVTLERHYRVKIESHEIGTCGPCPTSPRCCSGSCGRRRHDPGLPAEQYLLVETRSGDTADRVPGRRAAALAGAGEAGAPVPRRGRGRARDSRGERRADAVSSVPVGRRGSTSSPSPTGRCTPHRWPPGCGPPAWATWRTGC
ncbi:hypothetical protein [Streptomyces echinatus]|uniref:hypothetical protein n=1 Tax=Streptomyces echinatus TaxID=67293 RepID=UPI0031ECC749